VSRPSGRKLAHELSNQLGIVISYAELLLEELDAADPNRPDLDTIDRASRRLQELLTGVTSFDKVGEEKRRQYADQLRAITEAGGAVLQRSAATDPVAADMREVLKAADAVAAILKPE
jgi:signal transduction histidine kinase